MFKHFGKATGISMDSNVEETRDKEICRKCWGVVAWSSVCRDPEWDTPKENGLYFDCCKTAFRPYDLVVISFLIIAKHHLGDKFIVRSDGEDGHWFDGKFICQSELGYGLNYEINEEGLTERKQVKREA